MKQLICSLFLILAPLYAGAETPTWQLVPSDSSLSFTATQNNAPVKGEFKKFTADIVGDPTKADTLKIKIVVDVGSINDPYNQLSDTLKDKEWFDTKMFPQATFISDKVTKTGDKDYKADGKLTIRDKTVPVTLTFHQEEYTPTKAKYKGSTTLKRIAFGVGQGEWSDTKSIKDDVMVDFAVTVTKK